MVGWTAVVMVSAEEGVIWLMQWRKSGRCKGEDVREDILLDPVDAVDGDELLDVFDCLDADGEDGVDEHGGGDLDELVLAVKELRDELGDELDGLKATAPRAVVRVAEDRLEDLLREVREHHDRLERVERRDDLELDLRLGVLQAPLDDVKEVLARGRLADLRRKMRDGASKVRADVQVGVR